VVREETMERKTWSQPQLVVLGRGKPEESVLEVCKNQVDSGMASPCHTIGVPPAGECIGVTGT
jgi:hypothetical protein